MYLDNSGIEHDSYTAACEYYGADTPAQLEAEERAEREEWLDHCTDHAFFPTFIHDDAIDDCIPF